MSRISIERKTKYSVDLTAVWQQEESWAKLLTPGSHDKVQFTAVGQNLSPGNGPGQFGQGLTSCFPKWPQQTLPTSFCACIFQWSSWALSDLISGALSIIWSQRLLRVLFAHSHFQKSIEIYFRVSKINSGYWSLIFKAVWRQLKLGAKELRKPAGTTLLSLCVSVFKNLTPSPYTYHLIYYFFSECPYSHDLTERSGTKIIQQVL